MEKGPITVFLPEEFHFPGGLQLPVFRVFDRERPAYLRVGVWEFPILIVIDPDRVAVFDVVPRDPFKPVDSSHIAPIKKYAPPNGGALFENRGPFSKEDI
jgi:hypothetical protein